MEPSYCDECGPAVRAKVIVCLPSGGLLAYCWHHGNQHRAALDAIGAVLYPIEGDIGV